MAYTPSVHCRKCGWMTNAQHAKQLDCSWHYLHHEGASPDCKDEQCKFNAVVAQR